MARTPRVVGAALALATAVFTLAALRLVDAQSAQRCFPEVYHCIDGSFRALWEQRGLPIFGLPLSPKGRPVDAPEGAVDPQQVQWFERHRIELHPSNPEPYTLLLGRVGAERLAQLGRDWGAEPATAPQAGCRYFPETGRNLCPPFLAAWAANGIELDGQAGVSEVESLALFGLPLTEARQERVDDQVFTVQWFERARFELHEGDGTAQVLFGRLVAELAQGGAELGVAPVAPPNEPATSAVPPDAPTTTTTAVRAPTTAPRAPTSTSAPRRPTATPDADEPEPSAEPSSTSAPRPDPGTPAPATRTPVPATSTPPVPATSTPAPATRTPAPPTSTPQPPTATPPPDPFKDPPPPTPPPGFEDDTGLPSNSAGGKDLDKYDAGTDTRSLGQIVCFDLRSPDPALLFSGEQEFTVTGPDGAVAETGAVELNAETDNVRWRWVPDLSYAEGIYTVSSTISPTLTVSGTLTIEAPAAGSGPSLVVVRTDSRLNEDDINSCNESIFGEPGDEFAILMTGFAADETVTLYLYGEPGCPAGTSVCYRGQLATVTTDGDGKASLALPTEADYPSGRYIVLTEAQALTGGAGPDADWPQRLTLR